MNNLIFLKPYLKEMIWGGTYLKNEFNFTYDGDKLGEAWIVSGIVGSDSIVYKGQYSGMYLSELYNEHRELFGNIDYKTFPLLIKYIDAKDDLSIQVHPDDEMAKKLENYPYGKTECWYIIDCDENADIIIGHKARTRNELKEMVENKKWNELLNVFPIKKGDFFHIPAGTLHAIRKGTRILEIQQCCDITYRVYDYDRLQNGKPRELHIDKSLKVINVPGRYKPQQRKVKITDKAEEELLVKNELFSVKRYKISGRMNIKQTYPFLAVNVIEGTGYVDGEPIKKGDSFIATSNCKEINIEGEIHIIVSHIV